MSNQEFAETIHGEMGCVACHGGDGISDDKDTAHVSMRRDPIAADACVQCHSDLKNHDQSLHENLAGYYTVIQQRTSKETWPAVEEAFGNHCESCHASCGQCHVSRPTSLGGGLTAGHQFKEIPPMNLTCTACHGSRVDMEYKGKNEGIPADVHWNKEGMPCFDCHSSDEMHGTMDYQPNHRYDGPPTPDCSDADCHADVTPADEIAAHDAAHLDTMACGTCHAAEYKNCYSCHVQKNEDDVPYFKIEPSVMAFKIGYNPRQSEDRPWKWVTLRHVPVDPDTFAYYGDDLLPNFNNLPTWVYAVPHTTQKVAEQAKKCNNCHGNRDIFLAKEDLLPYEVEANAKVVVANADVPAPVEEPESESQ